MSQHIIVHELCKNYRIPQRATGFRNILKSFFHKKYFIKEALSKVSFSIAPGELIGYIGPNGAGKSTTVKILSGILSPDSGEVKVLGKTPWQHRIEIVRQLGVVFGQRTQLWWELPVIESFELLKSIYKIPAAAYRETLDLLVSTLDLANLLSVPVRQLSLGQRMRCDIAASLLHSPKILFLDEPTIGLDAVNKLAVRDFIRRLNKEMGVTVMLTTHDMDDIEFLCSRVLVLHEGTLFLDGTLKDMRAKISPERHLIVDLVNQNESVSDKEASFLKQEGHRIWLSFNPTTTNVPDLIARVLANHPIRDLYVENPSIEEIIAKFYSGAKL